MSRQPAQKIAPSQSNATPGHVRQRLLMATRILLSTDGTKAATARAICARAGVQAPSLYHHFGDLQRLHMAAVNASFLEIMAGYRRHSRAVGTPAAIAGAWQGLLLFAKREPQMARLLVQSVVEGRTPAALDLTIRRLTADLTRMEQAGELRVSGEAAAKMLWTASVGAVLLATGDDHQATLEVNKHLLRTLMNGIMAA